MTAASADPGPPSALLRVARGDVIEITRPDEVGSVLELHLVAAPETDGTLAAADSLEQALAEAKESDPERARETLREGLAALESVEGATTSTEVARKLWSALFVARNLGDRPSWRTVVDHVVAHRERTLPPDHANLLHAWAQQAVMLKRHGEFEAALAIEERVLAGRERTHPAGHKHLVAARGNLARTLARLGHVEQALELEEQVVADFEKELDPDDPFLSIARSNLALRLRSLGELKRARAIQEQVLTDFERLFPPDHRNVIAALVNLAGTYSLEGDYLRAASILERVIVQQERVLPEGHPALLGSRMLLAEALYFQGAEIDGRALQEQVLVDLEAVFPADHPEVLLARENLAAMQEDPRAAIALLEPCLEVREAVLGRDHPDLFRTRGVLASSYHDAGDHAAARDQLRRALADTALPSDHPQVIAIRGNLVRAIDSLGEEESVPDLALLEDGVRRRVRESLALAPAQVVETIGSFNGTVELLVRESPETPEGVRSAFELVETLRSAAVDSRRVLRVGQGDPELEPSWLEAAAIARRLSTVVSEPGASPGEVSTEVARLTAERDRLLSRIGSRLEARGLLFAEIDTESVASNLEPHELLLTYIRLGSALHAFTLAPDGSLHRYQLGSADAIDELVTEWRDAVGRPIEGRGSSPSSTEPRDGDLEAASRALCERVLAPILRVALQRHGATTTHLRVCLDGPLFLVAVDALPWNDGRIGDRFLVTAEVSVAALRGREAAPGGDPSLVALGNVDYDARPETNGGGGAAQLPLAALRGADDSGFAPLPATRDEIEAIARLFEQRFDSPARVLSGGSADVSRVAEQLPGARFVHLATHGWFAAETVRCSGDPGTASTTLARFGSAARVQGFAPMALCGLALAGANRGDGAAGLITAEELCLLDLSACELAVLSACETNVGVRRAGLGVQSLQAALHAAGARSSVTSLWRVDDRATATLMHHFYEGLWRDELPADRALWRAKTRLAEEGSPVRDWAGWVLSGSSGR